MKRGTENALVITRKDSETAPAVIRSGGGNAQFAYDEFFKATINNEHTRRAYGRIVDRFLGWCEENKLELRNITPGLAGEYMQNLEGSSPTKNQALAALRAFLRRSCAAPRRPPQFVRVGAWDQAQRCGRQDARDQH